MRFQLLAAALVASLAASASAYSAPRDSVRLKPDLVVSSLANPPTVVFQGDGFSVRDRTRNIGRATAHATVTRYYLSQSGRRTAVGKRSVAALKPSRSAAGSVTANVPASLETGGYSLVACADATGTVNEASDRNNCRTASTKVLVKKPPPPV
jgi:hypothetical protein